MIEYSIFRNIGYNKPLKVRKSNLICIIDPKSIEVRELGLKDCSLIPFAFRVQVTHPALLGK